MDGDCGRATTKLEEGEDDEEEDEEAVEDTLAVGLFRLEGQ